MFKKNSFFDIQKWEGFTKKVLKASKKRGRYGCIYIGPIGFYELLQYNIQYRSDDARLIINNIHFYEGAALFQKSEHIQRRKLTDVFVMTTY